MAVKNINFCPGSDEGLHFDAFARITLNEVGCGALASGKPPTEREFSSV
jgi:hypothetical protein